MIRLVIADDEALVRKGLRLVLETEDDLEVVGEASDGVEAIDACRRLGPDVVLMDVRMPRLDGVEACRRLVDSGPTKVVMLTTFDLDEHLFAAVRAGASGFLLKASPPEELVAAIHAAAAGSTGLIPDRFAELTDRELEVLREMVRGASNAEIAESLYISETTVKTHVNHILAKLGVRDRIQVVVLAYEQGLVEPGRAAPGDLR